MRQSARIILVGLLITSSPAAISQANWELLFFDDFDGGNTEQWTLDPGWSTQEEGSNRYLVGENHYWANCITGQNWYDYSFTCKLNIRYGVIHVNFRLSDRGRYFLGISSDHISLTRDNNWGTYTHLEEIPLSLEQEVWHRIEIIANQKAIQFYVNEELVLQVWDEEAHQSGTIAFETLDDSKCHIDSVEITGAPQPDPPEGYDWIRTGGPPGGLGYDIRIHPEDPSKVIVTDNPSGINKSYDGGITWHQRNEGITLRTGSSREDIPVFSATIDPGNPDNVWCGTQNSRGIFKSEDCCETWLQKDHGVTEENEISFRGFAIHPYNSEIVLAAAEITTVEQGLQFNKTKGKIYKTTNGGGNWYQVWEGENLARVLLFDYLHPDTLYCSTGIFDREAYNSNGESGIPGGVGILRSYDGGESWTTINEGIDNLYTGYLEMHPKDPGILFAAAGNHTYHQGLGNVYKTMDGGESWKSVLEGYCFSVVTFSRSNPEVVYAFNSQYCYKSMDGGETWTYYYKPDEGVWGPPGIKPGIPISAAVDPENENRVFVNNYNGGNFLSKDGGETWANSSKGYTGADIRDILVHPDRPSVVYASGRSGGFKTVNGGKEWFGISNGPAETDLLAISTPDHQFDTVFGVVDGPMNIIRSVDGGKNWKVLFVHDSVGAPGSGFHRFSDIEVAPSDHSVIYAGMNHSLNIGNLDPDEMGGYGMYKSPDGGESWVEVNNGLGTGSRSINTIEVDPYSADIVYIGTYGDGIYKTDNGGESWEAVNDGLGSSDIRSIAIDPEEPEVLYAGTGNGYGIYKSVDGGELWVECNYGFQLKCPSYLSAFGKAAEGMELDARGPDFTSQDYDNVSWTKVLDIAIDPVNTDHIYAADFSSGIHFSADGGESWSVINNGISLRTVTCLSISGDGTVLYAGVKGDGVLRMVLENKPPGIQLTIPDDDDTVVVYRGDSVQFDLLCYDLNSDPLTYSWSFHDEPAQEEYDSTFVLGTAGLGPGSYPLTGTVSDGDSSVSVQWIVEVRKRTTDITDYQSDAGSDAMIRFYPNPFSESLDLHYLLPYPAEVTVDVYNVLGRKMCNIHTGYQEKGRYMLSWNGSDSHSAALPDGIYILRFLYRSSKEVLIQERKVVISR